ncbi:chloride channel protein [Leptolyngbya sp. 'hensonii']|uniref:chloride channel protein n=1 Tax=Leptolyngbya sp. 'hensonii' TaxID=1922337 RepID=UPI0009503063|nr:chloride channel protein [Leptolyngbya sp. 'hensonii']OLP18536.1 chloride channel protein [Leptolyngbya sp. 'hensonii']
MTPTPNVSLPETSVSPPPLQRISHILNRLQPNPETVVLLLAVLIGVGAGMGVVTFHYLIQVIHNLMLENLMGVIAPMGAWTLACVPTIGGLIVGLMRWRWRDFGPGISSMIAASQGGLRSIPLPLKPIPKMVAASVSLGTGASLGPEGPSVEIGANFGMLLGQVLQVSRERQRLLLGAGAAAGLAAGFNAPIAGVFFALEVVLGTTFATSAVSVVLLAAVVAALIAQIGLGAQPAFALPSYEVRSLLELPLYIGLGFFASVVSISYTQAIKFCRSCFQGKIPRFSWLGNLPQTIQPVLGGAIVGITALHWPQIMGVGYETIEAILRDVEVPLQLLLTLMVVKLAMTAISLGSGLIGGIFAPAMFLGASLGAAYGKIAATILSTTWLSIAAPPAYAMVGMAAVLAASARAPLTAIILMFELTRDYRIVLPLMAAVGLAVWLVERLKPASSGSLNLEQMGLDVKTGEDLETLQQLSVEEAMRPFLLTLPASLSILDTGRILINSHSRSALVKDEADQLIGIITLQDINRAIDKIEAGQASNLVSGRTIKEICTTELLYAYKDEPLADALKRMAARGLRQLPVIDRDHPQQVLGLLEQEEIAFACTIATTRKALRNQLPLPPIPNKAQAIELKQTA